MLAEHRGLLSGAELGQASLHIRRGLATRACQDEMAECPTSRR